MQIKRRTIKLFLSRLLLVTLFLINNSVNATTYNWTGTSDASTWADANNWNPNSDYPRTNNDHAIISSTAHSIAAAAGVTVGALTVNGNFTGTVTFNSTLTIDDAGSEDGDLDILNGTVQTAKDAVGDFAIDGDLLISNGGTLRARRSSTVGNGNGQTISANSLTMLAGSTITAVAEGFDVTLGPGGTPSGSQGGTHGGRGRINTDATYGSFTNPRALGSGGDDRAGGGAVILNITNNAIVNGDILADGDGGNDAGSGGSINITANTLSGIGKISASGGVYVSGPGGGGRIGFANVSNFNFAGTVTVNGGGYYADAGTVYFGNGYNLTLGGAGNISSLRLGTDDSNNYNFGNIVINNGGLLEIEGNTNTTTVGANGRAAIINASNLTIMAGGSLSSTALGFELAAGPGGTGAGGQGGSHAGRGRSNPDASYGSYRNPTALGSGGDDRAGGGALILNITNKVVVNGTMMADGEGGNDAGSGGSINITANTLSGSGTISASGGVYTSPGGGGRISLVNVNNLNFTGSILANAGGTYATTGTIYFGNGYNLTLGDAGNLSSLRLGTDDINDYNFGNIIISNGGLLEIDGNTNDAVVGTNGRAAIINASNLTIMTGGSLDASGYGFAIALGPGGTGTGGWTATHGGVGRYNTDATYGSFKNPTELGSGGDDRDGGGALILNITNKVIVNGTMLADGEGGNDGGSGGSINITANTLSGNGTISAAGGVYSSAGGGGRISFANVNNFNFDGTLTVNGGGVTAKAGTIYFGNGYNLTLGGAGNMSSLRLGSDDSNNYNFGNLVINNGGLLEIDSNTNTATVGVNGHAATINAANLTVMAGASIDASSFGFEIALGPGGSSTAAHGGAHGGKGANNTDAAYGSTTNPRSLGSGGDDRAGGGAVILNVANKIVINGNILADGDGTNDAGSGGTVNIRAGTLVGSGLVSARGGSYASAPGGGGRVAVKLSSGTDFGSVKFKAFDGGYTKASAGTVYLEDANDGINGGELIIDNNGSASVDVTSFSKNELITKVGSINVRDNGIFLIAAGETLDLKGRATTVTVNGGTLTNTGTMLVNGTSFVKQNSGSFTSTASTTTVMFRGESDAAADTINLTNLSDHFYHFSINGADANDNFLLGSNLDVNGNLNIISGSLNGSSMHINLAGNWSNTGTYTPSTSAVILDGTNHTITGNTNFYDLIKIEGANDSTDETLTFISGFTQTISNGLTLTGRDADDRLNLFSDIREKDWFINPQGSRSVDFIRVQDSTNTNTSPILPTNALDNGNTFNWFTKAEDIGNGWTLSTKITINASAVNGDVYGFPVYVDLSHLPGKFFGNVRSDGGDIRVTRADRWRQEPFELVSLDTSNASGELWFKAEHLSATSNADYYIFYGNGDATLPAASASEGSQNVWSNDFIAVYHFNEDPNGDVADSIFDSYTVPNHGDPGGSMTTADLVNGQLGKAIEFDGSDDSIRVSSGGGAPLATIGTGDGTITAWASHTGTANYRWLISNWATAGLHFGLCPSGKLCGYFGSGSEKNSTYTIPSDGSWHYYTARRSSGTVELLADATANGSFAGLNGSFSATATDMGSRTGGGSQFWTGSIDELRVSKTARSNNWIKTEYNNQNSVETFYTVEEEGSSILFNWNLF